MFKVGDIVKVEYDPDSGVMNGSIVWNYEHSIFSIASKHTDQFGKLYYHVSPIEIHTKIRRRTRTQESEFKALWRDKFLVPYNEKEYEIDNMDLFLDD